MDTLTAALRIVQGARFEYTVSVPFEVAGSMLADIAWLAVPSVVAQRPESLLGRTVCAAVIAESVAKPTKNATFRVEEM